MSSFEEMSKSYRIGEVEPWRLMDEDLELVLEVPDRICLQPRGNPFWADLAYRTRDSKFFLVLNSTNLDLTMSVRLVEVPDVVALWYASVVLAELMRTLDDYIMEMGKKIAEAQQRHSCDDEWMPAGHVMKDYAVIENECLDKIGQAKAEIEQIRAVLYRLS